jgi:hypothetical protein
MTQWTLKFDSHRGENRRAVRCASTGRPAAYTLGQSKDVGSVIAPRRPPG